VVLLLHVDASSFTYPPDLSLPMLLQYTLAKNLSLLLTIVYKT
jgi:hypothetical protein